MVGTTAGPTLQVPRVGEAKNEGHIPDGWYDDWYEGEGDLWVGENVYTKLPDGRGYYRKIVPVHVIEESTAYDPTSTPVWTVGTKYEVGNEVTLSESYEVTTGNFFEFVQVYRCKKMNTAAESNKPKRSANPFWILDRTLHTSLTQEASDIPDPIHDPNIGITPRHIIQMNDHAPTSTTVEGQANEPGEYKFGDRTKGVWESYVDMANIVSRAEIITMNLVDRLGNSHFSFYASLNRSSNIRVVWRISDNKWIKWIVQSVFFSTNLRRAGIEVSYEAHNFDDGDEDVPTDIHFPVGVRIRFSPSKHR